MRHVRLFPLALIAAAVALTPGCSRIKTNQGYIVDEALFTAIQPGVDNRDSVQKTLGRPTFTAQFDNREWYYVSRNTEQLAFMTPRAKEQSILIVTFDAAGTVAGVQRRGLEKTADINPEGDKTPTLGRETGLFEDLFGNIGRFGGAGGGAGDAPAGRDGPR